MGRIVIAEYRDPGVDFYRGNPLIEALPAINSVDEAIRRLMAFPEYHQSHRHLPPELRFHYLQRILEVFVALPRHIVLEQKIGAMLRGGYRARHPHDPRFVRDVSARLKAFGVGQADWAGVCTGLAQGSDLIGTSGVGKSTALRRILDLYPQGIIHSEYGDRRLTLKQIVWLHLECPSEGGIKALCREFFKAADELFETTHLQKFGDSNNDTMMMNMARVAAWQSLGLLAIDEVQNLSIAKSGGADQFLNYVVRLRNEIGLPVILVGTPEAEPILAGKFRNARRGTTWGDIAWDRFSEHDADGALNEEWDLFVESIWRYQYTATPTPLTNELRATLYDESQGIPDLAVKAYLLAQAEAILNCEACPEEIISPQIIRKAARAGFALCQTYLEALRKGDEAALLRMKDLRPNIRPRIEQVEVALEQRRAMALINQANKARLSEQRTEAVSSWLVEAGCPPQEAIRIAKEAAAALGPVSDEAALRLAAVRIWDGAKKAKPQVRTRKPRSAFAPDSLMEIARVGRANEQTGYEALKVAGMVKGL